MAAGTVTFELRDDGEDPHDLRAGPQSGGAEILACGETPSGARPAREAMLARGQHYLWCSLEGHEAAGMHATLRVE